MKNDNTEKNGFTIIEVMLVLAIAGLLLVGTIRGTYGAVRTQRYNDAVNTFAENLRQAYNEVLNPRSENDQVGNSLERAIYGKVLQFGGADDSFGRFYTVTLTGPANVDEDALSGAGGGFVNSLISQNVTVACNTLTERPLLWESQAYDTNNVGYTGIVIIARHPRTGAVHTAVAVNGNSGITNDCVGASNSFKTKLQNATFTTSQPTVFCIKSDEASVVRGVRLAADGVNSSAVSILTEEESRGAGCR